MRKIEMMLEQLEQNFLKESALSSSADSSVFAQLILPLLKKIYLDSLISQVADVQPLKGPVGKIASLFSTYSGSGSSAETNTHPDSSFLIVVEEDVSSMSVDDVLTADSDSSEFTIRFIEGKKLLVARTSGEGVPVKDDTFNSATFTASYATFNRAAIKKLFHGYSGTTDADGNFVGYSNDDNTQVRFIGFETRTVDIKAKSRKLKSKLSQEQLQDWLAVYKEKGIDLVSESIANEIRQEIDKEFISYLKFIASYVVLPPTKIDLKSSIAVGGGGLKDVTDDLVVNIFLAGEQIVRDTKRNRTIFVLADPVTCAFLQTNAVVTKAYSDEQNPYKVGTVGTYPLYSDLFSDVGEYFILVGYQGDNDGDGDTGVVYSPYNTSIHQVTDTNLKENVLYLDRYAMTRHPQDVGNINKDNIWHSDNESNSDFFKMMLIDYGTTELKNFANISIPNFK